MSGLRPAADDVRTQLDKILASADFAASPQLARFLRFVVEETIAGRSAALKAYTIGVQVFHRAESFDPQTDSIVRVEGSRLRRKLNQYYLSEGRDDPLRIDLPKGSYVPRFERESGDGATNEPATRRFDDDSRRRTQVWRRYALVLLAVIVVGVGLLLGWRFMTEKATTPVTETRSPADISVTMPNGPSIAVLPFKNLSGDKNQDYFGVGLAEQIIADLTRFRDLFVIAADTTVKYAAGSSDPEDIGATLGVNYVLEGSVQRLPPKIRVTATLINVETGRVIWSDNVDRTLNIDQLLELQDDITEKIVVAIAPSYGAIHRDTLDYINRHETDSFYAYDCVLRAMAYRNRDIAKPLPEIIDCLEQSVQTDPRYAQAWALLSIIYLNEYVVGYNPDIYNFDPEQRGYEAALRAVDEDPQSALGYSALSSANFFRHDLDLFLWYGIKAIGLNPNDVDILASFGGKSALAGEWEFGLRMIEKAIALNPSHPDWYFLPIAYYYYATGEYRLADVEASKIRPSKYLSIYVLRAMIAGQLGNQKAAKAALSAIQTLDPDYAKKAREIMRRWNLPGPLIAHAVEGLRKAGLEIPEP